MAEQYDDARPRYPEAMPDHVEALVGTPRTLEIGCGTGILTRAWARRGAVIVALDPDADMLAVAKDRSVGQVKYIQSTLEDYEPDGRFRLALAGQSWHWVDEHAGAGVVARAVQSGGVLALAWQRPDPNGFEHQEQLDDIYRRTAPSLVPGIGTRHLKPVGLDEEANLPEPFVPLRFETFPWSEWLSVGDYLALQATHSNHILMPDGERRALFAALADFVGRFGGLEARYLTHLYLFQRT